MKAAPLEAPAWALAQAMKMGLPARRNGRPPAPRTSGRVTARWHACGQPVLTGLAWPWDITLDIAPLTPLGELFAILAGRATAQVEVDGTLRRRRPGDIALDDADAVQVHIAHQCGGPFPEPNPRWADRVRDVTSAPPF